MNILRHACGAAIAYGLLLCSGCDLIGGPERQIDRAERAVASGEYGEAMVSIRNALEKSPNDPRALRILAVVSLQSGDLDGADAAIERASAAGATTAETAEFRARLLAYRGRWQQLLDALDDGSITLEASRANLYRAQANFGLGKFLVAYEGFRSAVATAPQLVPARVGLAESRFVLGNPDGARRDLEKLVGEQPESAEAWLAKGLMLLRRGEADAAEVALVTALKHARKQLTVPEQVRLISTLADRRLFKGDVARVRELYSEMVQVSPQGAATRLFDAKLAIADGNPEAARRAIQPIVTQNPLASAARMLLVSAFLAEQNMQQALQQVDELVAQSPASNMLKIVQATVKAATAAEDDSGERWSAIGAAQLLLDQPAAARTALQTAIKKKPEQYAAAASLVTLDLKSGQMDAALAGAQQLKQRFPQERQSLKLLGDVYLARKEFTKAEAEYTVAWRAKHDVTMALARANARKLGDLGDATAPLREWLAEHPDDWNVRLLLAEEQLAAGDRVRAVEEYERILRAKPDNVIVLNNLALLYSQAGDRRAITHAKRAYQLSPTRAAVADTYGWLLAQVGKHAEGVTILESAHNAATGDGDIGYHYASALAAIGKRSEAKQLLGRLLDVGTEFTNRKSAEQLLAAL